MNVRSVIDCLDYTLLDHEASVDELTKFVTRANADRVGAVCIFAEYAEQVKPLLDAGIKLAVVAGGFPVGSQNLDEIRKDIRAAADSGADEIDVVLEPRDAEDFPNEIELAKLTTMRDAAGKVMLKVILETPLLDERNMRAVARMSLAAGADFIKTCTGKRGPCSDEAAEIFAYEIMRHELTFKEKRGMKLSGGIKTSGDIARLTNLVNAQDPSIISAGNSRFRVGASSVLDNLLNQK